MVQFFPSAQTTTFEQKSEQKLPFIIRAIKFCSFGNDKAILAVGTDQSVVLMEYKRENEKIEVIKEYPLDSRCTSFDWNHQTYVSGDQQFFSFAVACSNKYIIWKNEKNNDSKVLKYTSYINDISFCTVPDQQHGDLLATVSDNHYFCIHTSNDQEIPVKIHLDSIGQRVEWSDRKTDICLIAQLNGIVSIFDWKMKSIITNCYIEVPPIVSYTFDATWDKKNLQKIVCVGGDQLSIFDLKDEEAPIVFPSYKHSYCDQKPFLVRFSDHSPYILSATRNRHFFLHNSEYPQLPQNCRLDSNIIDATWLGKSNEFIIATSKELLIYRIL
ncbi:hypothetical protein O9G_000149 [Rozella allomycis CSF55]|uniref:WD40 repeat-like protein n=1 Tax=Rozella allomycis (strain CSF55) TaxID=988480 RepID=A0A075ANW9_ROZAC|nr:hypothetical protein O9G_000149 [Rozella allomycis CSF55]|eukprot:EPZ31670.1 hypothetical protein O9G_000149 [Rozella allomycis CSF55]